jgi:hypothetical protein
MEAAGIEPAQDFSRSGDRTEMRQCSGMTLNVVGAGRCSVPSGEKEMTRSSGKTPSTDL